MAVSPLGTAGISHPALGDRVTATPPVRAETPFSDVVSALIRDASEQQLTSDGMVKQFVTGETDNVHDVVLSVAKADLSFRLLLEIRNRLIDSYQELMRMQV